MFLLGHQLAFLGLAESSSTLIAFLGEFALIASGISGAFSLIVMWSTILLERYDRVRSGRRNANNPRGRRSPNTAPD